MSFCMPVAVLNVFCKAPGFISDGWSKEAFWRDASLDGMTRLIWLKPLAKVDVYSMILVAVNHLSITTIVPQIPPTPPNASMRTFSLSCPNATKIKFNKATKMIIALAISVAISIFSAASLNVFRLLNVYLLNRSISWTAIVVSSRIAIKFFSERAWFSAAISELVKIISVPFKIGRLPIAGMAKPDS